MENVTSEKVKQLQSEGKKILVDYWAPWCGPCKTLIPRLESIESQYKDVTFLKVNVDENPGVSAQFGVRNIPTILFIKNGEVADKSVGAVPKAQLASKLDAIL